MDARNLRFSRRGAGFALLVTVVLFALCLPLGVYAILALSAWWAGWPPALVGTATHGWPDGLPPVFTIICAAVAMYLVAALPLGYVTILSTVIVENGASQRRPPLMRRIRIEWSDVTEVERDRQTLTLKIRSGKRYVWLKMNFYKHQREVERFVRQHAPPDTRFTDFGQEIPNF